MRCPRAIWLARRMWFQRNLGLRLVSSSSSGIIVYSNSCIDAGALMAPAFELPLASLEGYIPAANYMAPNSIAPPTMGSDPDFGVPSSDLPIPSNTDSLIDPSVFEYFLSHFLFSSRRRPDFPCPGVLAFLCFSTPD